MLNIQNSTFTIEKHQLMNETLFVAIHFGRKILPFNARKLPFPVRLKVPNQYNKIIDKVVIIHSSHCTMNKPWALWQGQKDLNPRPTVLEFFDRMRNLL